MPPASGNARVCAAVSLGWQMAKLYHSPVREGAAADPRRGARLPGISGFPDATQAKWLAEQINATVTSLLPATPGPVTEALGQVTGLLGDRQRRRDPTLDAVFTLHCRLLESLTVADFRLGKAYGLGRALAETTLVPAAAAADDLDEAFGELLAAGRVTTIKDWLVELKTMLPDHAAYAISAGLTDWQQWVAAASDGTDWRSAQLEMRVQGQLWRGLITGEKAAADMLNLSGYLAAARQIAKRAIVAARWPILIAGLAAAGVIVTVLMLHSVSPTARLLDRAGLDRSHAGGRVQGVRVAARLGGQRRRGMAVADGAGRIHSHRGHPHAAAGSAPPAHRGAGRHDDVQHRRDVRGREHAACYLRTFTARATTSATTTIDTKVCRVIAPLAHRVIGIVSVGLNAVALVKAT